MGILDSFRSVFGGQPEAPEAEEPRALAPSTRADVEAMSPRAAGSMSMLMRKEGAPQRGAAEVLEAYNQSPYLRAAIGRTAQVVASVRWHLYAGAPDTRNRFTGVDGDLTRAAPQVRHRKMRAAVGSGEVVAIKTHPFITLMDQPNPYMTGRVARQVTVAWYKLIGDAIWILDGEEGELPINAFPAPGTWVKRRPTPEQPTFEVSVGGATWTVPASRVLSFLDADPARPYGAGSGIGTALRTEIDIDENAAETIATFFQNRALPDAIISLKGANKSILERAKREWANARQGFRKAYGNQWTNGDISVERLDTAFKDMQLVELRKAQRDVFQQATGTPPEKMGIVTNSNKATALAASIIDATDVQIPILEVLREQFTRLAQMFDERLVSEYDSPVPDDVEAKRLAMVSAPHLFKIDAINLAFDEEPIGEENGGEGYFVNGAWYPSLKSVRPVAVPQGDEPDATTPDGEPAPVADGGAPLAASALNGAQVASLLEIVSMLGDGSIPRETAEAVIAAAFPSLSKEQIDGILNPIKVNPPEPAPAAELAAPAARALVRIDDKALRAILKAIGVDDMGDPVEEAVRSVVDAYGQEAIDALGADVEFSESTAVKKKMRTLRSSRVDKLINATTRAQLSDALRGVETADLDSLEATVSELFDGARETRAPMIAATETIHHGEWASLEGAKQSGIEIVKEWITNLDGLQRDSHEAMDGQVQEPDDAFVIPPGFPNSDAQAMVPGGFGVAGEDINCRCSVSLRAVSDDEKKAARALGLVPREGETRADFWRRMDAARSPWEKMMTTAVLEGFDAQESAVLAAVRKLFSKE